MRIPLFLLRLLPMWNYICPKCKREVPRKSHTCPHCRENYGLPLRVPSKLLHDKQALGEYVHKFIMPKVNEEMRVYLTNFFTVLFSDGFESGDFSAWTGVTGNPTVQSTTKHHGSYAMECAIEERINVYKVFSSLYSELYARNYFLISGGYPSGKSVYGLLAFYETESWTPIVRVFLCREYNGQFTIGLNYFNGATEQWTTNEISLSEDTWYSLELYGKVDAANGGYTVYLNGENVLSVTGKDTTNKGNFASLYTGTSYCEPDNPAHLYIDCIVVADAYIGPEATLQTVTDAFGLSDAVRRNKSFAVADATNSADVVWQNRTFAIADAVGATDSFLGSISLSKVLQITETVSLAEAVQVGVGGIKKTRLFLVIGDLALQLTGD